MQFFVGNRSLFGKAVTGNVGRDRHLFGPGQRAQPVGGIRGAHGRKDAVEENLAQEEDLPGRQVDGEIAASVSAAEKQNLNVFAAECQRLPVVDELGAGRQRPGRRSPPAGRLALEDRLGRRVDDVCDARRK